MIPDDKLFDILRSHFRQANAAPAVVLQRGPGYRPDAPLPDTMLPLC